MKSRCTWPGEKPQMIEYHDREWGVPVHEDQKWFEFIVLDAFQAGLSWEIVLNKREAFRRAFLGFDPVKVAEMPDHQLEALRHDASIIRNKLKIFSTRTNAKAFLKIQKEWGSFDKFIWSFTDGEVVQNHWKSNAEIPAKTPLSDQVSKAMINAGFKFVGSTIVYAFLQAGGIVNDHLVHCFRHAEL